MIIAEPSETEAMMPMTDEASLGIISIIIIIIVIIITITVIIIISFSLLL